LEHCGLGQVYKSIRSGETDVQSDVDSRLSIAPIMDLDTAVRIIRTYTGVQKQFPLFITAIDIHKHWLAEVINYNK